MTAMGGGSSLSEERSWFTPPYNSYRKRTVLATTADYINVVTQLRTAGIDINAQVTANY